MVAPEASAPRPVMVVLHGAGSSSSQIQRISALEEWTHKEKWVVVYPEALAGHWNDGRPDAFPAPGPQDDLEFLNHCLDLAVKEYQGDPKRLYVCGFDSGGALALAVGLRFALRVRAVACCMGGLPLAMEPKPGASRPAPMLLIQSRKDPCWPFLGGEVRYFQGRPRGQILSSDRLMQSWTSALTGQAAFAPQTQQSLSPQVRLESWSVSPPVLRLVLEQGGHLWPGTEAYVSEELFGPLSRDFSASERIFQFFEGLP